MEEIIQNVTQAEKIAAEIKERALLNAAGIASEAEKKALEIAKANEAECKILREREIKKTEALAEKQYNTAVEKQRAESSAYADKIIAGSDGAVLEIVRRITRGSC